ncbi:hypothetical protein M885DRAFT_516253 [Pelagophyceae sp. CCMP2097]|nr:hypothetical protein M885DRAFT_516253 [Pelagophyceae sp. CCMP2097]
MLLHIRGLVRGAAAGLVRALGLRLGGLLLGRLARILLLLRQLGRLARGEGLLLLVVIRLGRHFTIERIEVR